MSPETLPVRRKVLAYITSDDYLLVFRHLDFPEAGMQVPAGTVEPGEKLTAAVLRESWEETGLTGLTVAGFLGEQVVDGRAHGQFELHHRSYFHLVCGEPRRPPWRHLEVQPSTGGPSVRFELFWARLPDQVPPLIAGHDFLLPELLGRLRLT